MDWNDIRYFLVAARTGNLTAAAAELQLSASTLSRRLSALEADLGMRLLQRTPRGVSATAEGRQLLRHAERCLQTLVQFEQRAGAVRAGLSSRPLRISTTELVCSEVLAPQVSHLRRRHPEIRLDLRSMTRNVSIAQHEADLAIRLARPIGERVVIRRLRRIHQGLYGSQAYLDDRDPGQLQLHDEALISLDDSYGSQPELDWFLEHGLTSAVVCRSASVLAITRAVETGAGLALLPHFLARRRGLVEIGAPPCPSRGVWLAFHEDLRHSEGVRTVRNWIVDVFRQL